MYTIIPKVEAERPMWVAALSSSLKPVFPKHPWEIKVSYSGRISIKNSINGYS